MPHLGSLILTHEWDGEIKGLKDFPPADRPNPIIPFFAFRIMVGIGLIMIALSSIGAVTLGILASLALTRRRFRGMSAVSALLLSPLVIPYIVFGVGTSVSHMGAGPIDP